MGNVAYIFYGRGSDLGSFQVFARTLEADLLATYAAGDIIRRNVETRADFFALLENPSFKGAQKIGELHIFSHAIGAGLFLAYGDPSMEDDRVSVLDRAGRRGFRLSYDEVIMQERGVLFTDNLIRRPWGPKRVAIRQNFAADASIKVWGCNAAVAGWEYTDDIGGGQWVSAPSVGRIDTFYWRALNQQNMPKPSIAQALADYCQRPTHGASSGSHIEVQSRGRWTTTSDYRARHGVYPSGKLPHRLVPDVGTYQPYPPSPSP